MAMPGNENGDMGSSQPEQEAVARQNRPVLGLTALHHTVTFVTIDGAGALKAVVIHAGPDAYGAEM